MLSTCPEDFFSELEQKKTWILGKNMTAGFSKEHLTCQEENSGRRFLI